LKAAASDPHGYGRHRVGRNRSDTVHARAWQRRTSGSAEFLYHTRRGRSAPARQPPAPVLDGGRIPAALLLHQQACAVPDHDPPGLRAAPVSVMHAHPLGRRNCARRRRQASSVAKRVSMSRSVRGSFPGRTLPPAGVPGANGIPPQDRVLVERPRPRGCHGFIP